MNRTDIRFDINTTGGLALQYVTEQAKKLNITMRQMYAVTQILNRGMRMITQSLGETEAQARKLTSAQFSLLKTMPETAGGVSQLTSYVGRLGAVFGESTATMLESVQRFGAYGLSLGEAMSALGDSFTLATSAGISFGQASEYIARLMGEFNVGAKEASNLMINMRHTGLTASRSFSLLNNVMSRIYGGTARAAIEGMGIAITDQNGNFRDMNVIITELADKWDELDASMQGVLAAEIAGARNTAFFNNFLKDFDDSVGLTAEEVNNMSMAMLTGQWQMQATQMQAELLQGTLGQGALIVEMNYNKALLGMGRLLGWNTEQMSLFNGIMMKVIPTSIQTVLQFTMVGLTLGTVAQSLTAVMGSFMALLPILMALPAPLRIVAGAALGVAAGIAAIWAASSHVAAPIVAAIIGASIAGIVAMFSGFAEQVQAFQIGGMVKGGYYGDEIPVMATIGEQFINAGSTGFVGGGGGGVAGDLIINNYFPSGVSEVEAEDLDEKIFNVLRRRGVFV